MVINVNSNMKWISVKDSLPIIPEGRYGVPVIVATFDPIYAEENGGNGYFVHEAHFGSTINREGKKLDMYIGTEIDYDFMELWEGSYGYCWGPTSNSVTHWMPFSDTPDITNGDIKGIC